MVRAGKLRHRVALQNNTGTADSAGQVSESWTTYSTVYGEVIDTGGVEKVRGQQVDATISALVRIRYPASGTFPTAEHRVSWNSRIFNIQTVQRKDTHERELWLLCREAV
jgi:SPP1 family predicted phage head-tail adaptor